MTEDGKFLITVSRDKTAKIWDVLTGKEIRSFMGHDHTVNGFSQFDDLLATSSADKTVGIWELSTGELLWRDEMSDGYITSVAFSPSGEYLAVGSYEDSVTVLHGLDFSVVKKIKANTDKGTGYGVSVRFSPDGKYLAIGEDIRVAQLYHTKDWSLAHTFAPEQGWCGGCPSLTAFHQDEILKLSNSTPLTKYQLSTGDKTFESKNEFRDIAAVDYHVSGLNYLDATEDSIFVYKNENNQVIQKWTLEGEINDAAFHPLEDKIIVALDKIVLVTDYEGNELERYQGVLNQNQTGLDYDLGS